MKLVTITIPLLAMLAACGDDDGSKKDTDASTTTDATDTGVAEVDDTTAETDDDSATTPDGDTSVGTFGVAHVWSQDGATVRARFDTAIDATSAQTAGVFVLSPGDDLHAAPAITQVTVAGADVTLTVSPALATDTTWDLVVTALESVDGRVATVTAPVKATLFLNMVWHQHQPSYLDPTKDELQGPWVRKHAQKDYFDMTAMLAGHPKIHLNVNLTSSLLTQLQRYVDALAEHVDVAGNTVAETAFLAEWGGKTDPWIDLLLRDTPTPETLEGADKDRYWAGVWSMKSIAEPLRAFFPEYQALLAKAGASYTRIDLALLKVWFEIAWMDPGFLRGPVTVYRDGEADVVVDLSDVVDEDAQGKFRLDPSYTDTSVAEATRLERLESLANRLVAEQYKIMKGVFEVHVDLGWTGTSGQVEVLTTPFFHPILPLLYDTDLAAEGQPADPLPTPAFAYPDDATLQITMAVEYYTAVFGHAPRGMWPSEGAVAEEIVPALAQNGIEWIATDRQVLDRGKPGASHLLPYMIDADTAVGAGGQTDDELMIVFRDTEISDKVGFFYQSNPPAENVTDFVVSVLGKAGRFGEPRRMLSVILDGENAWEWYTQDHDAKLFLEGLYDALEAAYDEGAIVTVTGSEYIDGNAARGVPENPVSAMAEYENLWPGSWIGGRLDTWIGEVEENLGWIYLKTARDDLEAARELLEPKLGTPVSFLVPPETGDTAIAWWKAWRNVLSAEGSDWFWWYGGDQTAAGGDDSPFDEIFRAQLRAAYAELNAALTGEGFSAIEVPAFPPILQPEPVLMTGPFGTLPVLDGKLDPDMSEWVPPGGVYYDGDSSGAQADPNDDIARVFYGYNRLEDGRVFLGIDCREDLSEKLGTDYQLVIYTSQGHLVEGEIVADPFNTTTAEGTTIAFDSGGPARRIAIDLSGASPVATVQKADGAGGWSDVTATVNLGGPVTGGTLIELRFLLTAFGMANGDPLEMAILAVEDGKVVDTAPNLGTYMVFPDPTKLVTVIFELDVSGDQIPINQYITIADPPPPAGTGTASIVGNQQAFGNWSPNTVWMKDDGVAPDTAAGDGLWTFSATFGPGTPLQYKYTIGKAGDSWSGTEEYPLTNRGYTVPVDGTLRVRVRDVFADRPDPSGAMAPLTTATPEE
ncbi:MAG: hypothetical protein IT385_04485 [Deltaproteobacteria bacterium]|nr:hypothetical protein [Deltaproteobacteria bacterium]